MGKFRVLGGNHVEGGKKHVKGDVLESGRRLDEMFVNKFEKLSNDAPVKAAPITEPEKENTEPAKAEVKDNPLGEEVTNLFDGAEENDLKVFKKRKWFTVVDISEGETVLNDKGILADAVGPFIEDYVKSEG